jgi:hypothetical protein
LLFVKLTRFLTYKVLDIKGESPKGEQVRKVSAPLLWKRRYKIYKRVLENTLISLTLHKSNNINDLGLARRGRIQ